jgi:hypothetical protein
MSAEVLREAAALMRERAEYATTGPWTTPEPEDEYWGPRDVVGPGEPGFRYLICERAGNDAEHIASWHPAVALAVADWLERCVRLLADGRSCYGPEVESALAVANAYLGSDR